MTIYMAVFIRLYDAATWAFRKPRLALELVMVAALMLVGWRYNRAQQQLAQSKLEHGQLADGLQHQITIRDGQIEILRKAKGKVIIEIIYVPVESPVIIQYPDVPGEKPTVIVKTKGLTVRPGFGLEWAGLGVSPRIDFKVAYWDRYGLLVGGGKDGADVGVSRHLDDVLFWKPRNVEAFAGWMFLRMPGASQFVLGLRSNF